MVEDPGPLVDINKNAAATFESGKYNVEVLKEPKVVYRGGEAGTPLGQYFTSEPPASSIQVRIDSAVKPQWIDPKTGALTGTSYVDTVYAIELPAGTTIYTGPAGYQGSIFLGGKEQIFVSEPWKINGLTIKDSWSIK